MLNELETYAVLPARDLKRARKFYQDALGMEPFEEHEYGLMYRTPAGAMILVYETENAGTAKNTALGWVTTDLESEMKALRARGVKFEDYDFPGLKTENGVATSETDKTAWFTDTEGNILSLSQFTGERAT